jgi:hypothetical protein
MVKAVLYIFNLNGHFLLFMSLLQPQPVVDAYIQGLYNKTFFAGAAYQNGVAHIVNIKIG